MISSRRWGKVVALHTTLQWVCDGVVVCCFGYFTLAFATSSSWTKSVLIKLLVLHQRKGGRTYCRDRITNDNSSAASMPKYHKLSRSPNRTSFKLVTCETALTNQVLLGCRCQVIFSFLSVISPFLHEIRTSMSSDKHSRKNIISPCWSWAWGLFASFPLPSFFFFFFFYILGVLVSNRCLDDPLIIWVSMQLSEDWTNEWFFTFILTSPEFRQRTGNVIRIQFFKRNHYCICNTDLYLIPCCCM